MRITLLPAAAGLLLVGMLLTTEAAQAQTTKPTARPKPTAKATKPSKATPAGQPASAAAPAASVTIGGATGLKGKGAGRAMQLPENDQTIAARKRVEEARAQDRSAYTEELLKDLVKNGQSVFYDEHYSLPKFSVMGNLDRWRDHLVLQIALRDAGLSNVLEQQEVTLLAPPDAALFPVAPKLRLPQEVLRN